MTEPLFCVLGPIEVRRAGTPVVLGSTKLRTLLAALLVRSNQVVSTDSLVETLWPSGPPATARALVQTYVSHLRRLIEPVSDGTRRVLRTAEPGYSLQPIDVDAVHFEALFARGNEALKAGRAAEGFELLRDSLDLWRGPALADLADLSAIQPEAQRLDALRLVVTEAFIDAGIALGRHAEFVSKLQVLVNEHPMRERLWSQLMLCLYRSGRQADALGAYQQLRERLVDLGLEPGPAVVQLERDILTHDPALARSTAPTVQAQLPALLGRDTEVAALHDLMAHERLVTLVGPGGVGKTRLALETAPLASPVRDLVVLRLAAVLDDGGVVALLARMLDLRSSSGDLLEDCVRLIADRAVLLVLDTCEHLLSPVRDMVTALLGACPSVAILATSRERLSLPFERVFPVEPLPVPQHGADELGAASMALFLERARRVRTNFEPTRAELDTVADVVRRLDGLPLAIELAAGRLFSVGIDDLCAHLDNALDSLHGGRTSADSRHTTLRTTIDWSYRLLDASEQRLFRNLAVFADGFDLRTAQELGRELDIDLGAGRALDRLVDASMIVVAPAGTARYRMLDTLRAFGLDRLDTNGERSSANERLLCRMTALGTWLAENFNGADEALADRRLREELGSFRAAWQAARSSHKPDVAVDLLSALYMPASFRGLIEIFAWAEELAADPTVQRHPRGAIVLAFAADVALWRGDMDEASRLLAASSALPGADPETHAVQVFEATALALFRGDFERAADLALQADHPSTRAACAAGGVLATAYAGDTSSARDLTRRIPRTTQAGSAWYHYCHGEINGLTGNWIAAEQHYEMALQHTRRCGLSFIEGVSLIGLACALGQSGRTDQALVNYRQLLDYWDRTGAWNFQWTTLKNLSDLLDRLGDADTALTLRQAAENPPPAPALTERRAIDGPVERTPSTDPRRAVVEHAQRAITEQLTRPAEPPSAHR